LRRVFLAFTPDAGVRASLDALAGRCLEAAGGRRIAPGKLHLTLLFLAQARDAQVEAMAGLAAERSAPAVTLNVDRLGFWERGGIVWAGSRVCPPELLDWVADLHARARRIGFAVERRPFAPHVTLLRDARRVPRMAFDPFSWLIELLSLYESRASPSGTEYHELSRWPAGDGVVK
jgi:2'-5' RNA ligase